jgi:hypothetical protein
MEVKAKPTAGHGGLIAMAVVATLVGGVWWFADVISNYASAGDECIKFAEESDMSPAFNPDPNDKKIFVVNKWVKHGLVVVELGQHVAKKGQYQSRLCAVGGGQIRIPGMFEEWQYR